MISNVFKILDKQQKLNFILVLMFMLLSAVFEVVSISAVPSLIYFINNPEANLFNNSLLYSFNILKFLNYNNFLIILSFIVVFIFVLKNIVVLSSNYIQFKFLRSIATKLSTDIFKSYMISSYEFHTNNNSSYLLRNVTQEVDAFRIVLTSLLFILRETLTLIAIVTMLLFVNLNSTFLVLIIFSIVCMIIYFYFKNRLISYGKIVQEFRAKQIKTVNQGLGSVRELQLSKRENFFINLFYTYTRKRIVYEIIVNMIKLLPRALLEITALIISLFIIFYSIYEIQISLNEIIPLLTLYALSFLRILPAFNVITTNISSISFYKASIDLIRKEIKEIREKINLNVNNYIVKQFKNSFKFKNLTFKYKNSNKFALKNINITIKKGQSIGIVGSTGSGKTTLLNLILGLLEPDTCDVYMDDVKQKSNKIKLSENIGYIPQDIFLIDDTIKNNIALGLDENEIDINLLTKAIKISQLYDFVNKLEQKENTIVGEKGIKLSGGQRQRIGIARAIYENPEFVVLDEATSNLDNETERQFIESLNQIKINRTLIVVAHRLTSIKNCDIIYVMKDGEIVDLGKFDEISSKYKFLN